MRPRPRLRASGGGGGGSSAPELSSRPQPAALRREPVAQPARRERINSGRIMINASTPPAGGGGGRRGAAGGRAGRTAASLLTGFIPSSAARTGLGRGPGGAPRAGSRWGLTAAARAPSARAPVAVAARCRSREGSLRASGATSLSPKPIRAQGFLTGLLLSEAPWIPSHPGCLNLWCTGLGVVSNGGLSKQQLGF